MTEEEKKTQWSFEVDAGDWVWNLIRPDGTRHVSPLRFSTLQECIADATVHGYEVWIPSAERRTPGQ